MAANILLAMKLYDLYALTGDVWFKKGSYFYTLGQVQTIMREVLRTQPENAEKIFMNFKLSKKPGYSSGSQSR